MMFRQGTIAADRYLIATPIFNFTIPSTLKAYTDLSFIYAHSL
jgi:FMN-dependent NADH-azoreductase